LHRIRYHGAGHAQRAAEHQGPVRPGPALCRDADRATEADVKADARRGGDSGATLVIVLLLVTVIALVTGAVLTQVDTSVRTTVAMRDQAGAAYDGDAAAQVAVNQLRRSTFNNGTGSQCFGASGTLALPAFYPATNGQTGTAASSA